MSDLLKEKGIFAWFDSGPLYYTQVLVVPGNSVDRDGCVPANIYRYIKNIGDIAVQTEDGQYKILIVIPEVFHSEP